jgi:hypothetical protein
VSAAKIKPPGRQPSLRTPENMERVRQDFVRNRQQSTSRNAIALRMSDCTVRPILHEDLNFHPYKNCYGLSNKRSRHCKSKNCVVLLKALDNDNLNHVLMMDEANFHLCGNVNSQNCRDWATEKPHDTHQKP